MQLPQQFLSSVLPAQGWRVFNCIMPGPVDNRPVAQFDFSVASMHEADRILAWAIGKQADMYFAVGGYGEAVRVIKQGKNAGQTRVSRTAANALWHRCLRIDVDCGAGKPYADKRAGWEAVKALMAGATLPMPTIVDSGYGLHVYWLFNEDVALADWLALSRQLAAACAHHGLQVDPTTTEDAARILRLPGTQNFKHGMSVPVRELAAGQPAPASFYVQALAGYRPVSAPLGALSGTMPAAMQGMTSPLSDNLHPPYGLRGVLTQCPMMVATVTTQGRDMSEPQWHAALSLVWKAHDDEAKRDRVAHALSVGHPGYSDAEFFAKWAQVKAQNYEPPTCEKFAQLGVPQCQTCTLRATIKSPCVLGRAQPELVTNQPAVPLPSPQPLATPVLQQSAQLVTSQPSVQQGIFVMTPGRSAIGIADGNLTSRMVIHHGIPTLIKTEQPDPAVPPKQTMHHIGSYPIVEAERLLDTTGKMALTAITFNRHTDGLVRIEFSHRELSDSRAFAHLLQSNGVYMNAVDVKAFQDKFMPEFLVQLQRIKQANKIASRCGWTEDFQQFVLGTRIFDRSGTVDHIRPASAPAEMEAYHEVGDEAAWRAAFDLVLAGGPDRQAIIALGLAGPLMAFTGVDGVLLNAYSPQSGVGKSTLCDAILSVWGSPNKLRKDFRDTSAATFHLAAVSGNLPMVIDEFTNVDGRDLSNYIYTITQGRERHRLKSDSQLRDNVNRWCLPAIATSNLSVHAKLQAYRIDAVAEAARVFEVRLHPLKLDPADMGTAKRTIEALKSNYGFLGPRLVQLFMSKDKAYWQEMISKRIAWWDSLMAEDTGDRFRSVVAALCEVGAVLGTALGFNFDRPAIVVALRDHWKTQVEEYEKSRMHPQDFVASYIADNLPKFVLFSGLNGDQQMGQLPHEYVGEIRGVTKNQTQIAVQSVIIPMKNLRSYVADRNGDFKAVLEWFTDQQKMGGVVQQTGQMTFMAGSPRSIRLQGVRFTSAIMGHPVVTVAPTSAPLSYVAPTAKGATP